MIIREFENRDKNEVIQMIRGVLKNIFNGDPKQFSIIKELENNKGYISFLVTEIDGHIVGTLGLKKINSQIGRLKRLYIKEEYRKKGIAQKMLNICLENARLNNLKEIKFSVYPIMENARNFYKKNGFMETRGKDVEKIHLVKYLSPTPKLQYHNTIFQKLLA